ncbi:uncharacterized protein M421DRAFT_394551 [Didymella exigua CBS 183.55]|uniref:Uncharacterized protein n=1 Tax=Didymella exigua CBS 183.55 TaxID=1150837 RepID=A0A6A5RI53_9PLEO|nr:uncharacterized protein M421DRAFT_394551 [Didymella exigua CBS 183.55]KAF1926920.1 hypothetical protein M421DRAFT_394551 [Didymella exigua CBS 183.55]
MVAPNSPMPWRFQHVVAPSEGSHFIQATSQTQYHAAVVYEQPRDADAAADHNAVLLTDRSTPARTKESQSVRSRYPGHSSFAEMSVVNEKCVLNQLAAYAMIGCGF